MEPENIDLLLVWAGFSENEIIATDIENKVNVLS